MRDKLLSQDIKELYILRKIEPDATHRIGLENAFQHMTKWEKLGYFIRTCREQDWWSDINYFLTTTDDPFYYCQPDIFIDLIYDYLYKEN